MTRPSPLPGSAVVKMYRAGGAEIASSVAAITMNGTLLSRTSSRVATTAALQLPPWIMNTLSL
jgi:hypothetical protein